MAATATLYTLSDLPKGFEYKGNTLTSPNGDKHTATVLDGVVTNRSGVSWDSVNAFVQTQLEIYSNTHPSPGSPRISVNLSESAKNPKTELIHLLVSIIITLVLTAIIVPVACLAII